MEDNHFQYEYQNETLLHPLAAVAVVVLGVAMLIVPRRYAVIPMILIACFISSAQRITILSLDFNLLRVMVVFGWLRLLGRDEYRGLKWKTMDTLIVLWALSSTITYTLLHGEFAALINKLGTNFDAAGMYFLFRCLVRSWRDLCTAVLGFMVVGLPVAVAFLVEWHTAHNLFAIFGGVWPITIERQGRLRCQGAFAHPILAGCFWASLLPLFAAQYWRRGKYCVLSVASVGAALIVVVACASSTPVAAVGLGLVGACFIVLRRRMRSVRWVLVCTLVGLHLLMKAPVWHLVSRIDIVGGSTGWHRFNLIDQAIKRVSEWWLLGTRSTAHWGYGMFDVTNQYVLEGVRGGLITMVLFIAIIATAFTYVGRMVRAAEGNKALMAVSWALGTTLFVHCVTFIAVSYFGQIIMPWYLLLAVIGGLAPAATAHAHSRRPAVRTPANATRPPSRRRLATTLERRSQYGLASRTDLGDGQPHLGEATDFR